MSTRHIVLEGFDEWIAWCKNCSGKGLQQMNDRIARSIVIQGFENTASHTPRRTGRLAQSLGMGAAESYVKIQTSPAEAKATYGTCVPYAAYVEEGYTQHKGQFVPGYWSGGKFVYVKGSKTGMVLTGQTVEGRHMFEKSLDDLANGDLEAIVLQELQRLYAELG